VVAVELDLTNPGSHRVAVVLRLQPRLPSMRLQLPAWTPGSYLIRDYVRQLEQLQVRQGDRSLQARRIGPACWQIEPDPAGAPLEIRYAVLASELSVRTCHLDQDHGFLALAAVVLELEGERWSRHHLRCHLPDAWRPYTALPADPQGDGWWADDLDQLLDSPLEVGPHAEQPFTVNGVPHRWVTWCDGPDEQALPPQLLADVEQVCLACCRLMGVEHPAASTYLFVLHLLDQGYGGLEHDNGSVLVYSRDRLHSTDGYRQFLQLVAHEYLHQWNVRRLRPQELAPIDYSQAVPVPTLWFAEGITSYVDQLLPLLAGLSTPEQVLADLGSDLSRYRLTPGRAVQSLRDSSEEAWVKLYRADAYAPDNQISYYLKGAVLALCLDLHLRRQGSCLAVVLQALWRSHGHCSRGYSEADLVAAFSAEAADLAVRLPDWLRSVDDPDLDGYLRDVGLRLQPVEASHPWIGAGVALEGQQLLARRVHRHGPAEQAGLMVGDEVLALDGLRLRQVEALTEHLRAGQDQDLLISRRNRLRTLTLRSVPPQVERYTLEVDPAADGLALQRQREWLALVPAMAPLAQGAAGW
jgi:predicted metalloprotease with PDZ domain